MLLHASVGPSSEHKAVPGTSEGFSSADRVAVDALEGFSFEDEAVAMVDSLKGFSSGQEPGAGVRDKFSNKVWMGALKSGVL